jgi:hypothetical protein
MTYVTEDKLILRTYYRYFFFIMKGGEVSAAFRALSLRAPDKGGT